LNTIAEKLQIAFQHHQAGQLKQAEALYRQILQQDPQHADTLHLLGALAHYYGHYDQAIKLVSKAISYHENNPLYFYQLGLAANAARKTALAEKSFRHALHLKPDYAAAYNDLGTTLKNQKKINAAIECYQHAILHDPDFLDAYFNLGIAYSEQNNFDAAIAAYQRALQLDPDDAEIYNNLGDALKDQGHLDKAIEKFERAVQLKPDYAGAYYNLGYALRDKAEFTEAIEAFRKSLYFDPDCAEAYSGLSEIKGSMGPDDIVAMKSLLAKTDLIDDQRMHLNFALGNAYESVKEYDEAFSYYHEGNSMMRSTYQYSIEKDVAFFNILKNLFDKDFYEQRRDFGLYDNMPIFILGMPRSGTTLIEQILSCHSQVHGAGEINDLNKIMFESAPELNHHTYTDYIASLDRDEIIKFGKEYIKRITSYSNGTPYVINKSPVNFQHIGMIRLIFPNAKIIHCKRNPVDTCLSAYKHCFTGRYYFAYDLQELGQYYKLYEELMSHWHKTIPGYIFDNQYEELIENQEIQSRKILEFVGLPWDDSCLNFHQSKRPVKTASFAQVRQPIYKTSVALWKHYEKHLAPLQKVLEHI